MSDKSIIETPVIDEEGLRKSLEGITTLIENEGPILKRCLLDIEDEDMAEIQAALVKAGVIPPCLSLNDGAILCATFNDEYGEYFIGVTSLRDLEPQMYPVYANTEFCFGATLQKEDGFVQIIQKGQRLMTIYPFNKEDFKEEHVQAIQTLITVLRNSQGYPAEEN